MTSHSQSPRDRILRILTNSHGKMERSRLRVATEMRLTILNPILEELVREGKNIDKHFNQATRSVYQVNSSYWNEEIILHDENSPFAGKITNISYSIGRSEYINELVGFCGRMADNFSELARQNTTSAITFYPKIIDNRTCTVLEYTGVMSPFLDAKYYDEPTNVVGLFMPLNETKEGCDRYLILVSGNQTADWLDSVKVSKVNKAI